jgi:plasmid maintenance system killer protein
MRVLIACEYSGRVREAFRRRGHDAWSCDLLESEDGSHRHIQGDVLEVIGRRWDLMVAHPPCTHLAVSGSRHFEAKRADGRQQEGIEFFLALARAPIPRIAIENPVCIMSSIWREPDQTIQPWMFGHGETKATCLWLKGLPHLVPTDIVSGRHPRVHLMPPGPNRWKERSRTYEGIAEAMADQWADYTDLVTIAEAA